MPVEAKSKNVRISAQKARLIIDLIRGLPVAKAVSVLTFCTKKAALPVLKTLNSAIANAEHNENLDIDELVVSRAFVDEASTLKRMHARARGRGARILKRSCHITVMVSEQ